MGTARSVAGAAQRLLGLSTKTETSGCAILRSRPSSASSGGDLVGFLRCVEPDFSLWRSWCSDFRGRASMPRKAPAGPSIPKGIARRCLPATLPRTARSGAACHPTRAAPAAGSVPGAESTASLARAAGWYALGAADTLRPNSRPRRRGRCPNVLQSGHSLRWTRSALAHRTTCNA